MKANAVSRLLSSLVWIDQYYECCRLTTLIIFWQNTLPANIRKWVFHEIERDGITWRNYKFAWNSCITYPPSFGSHGLRESLVPNLSGLPTHTFNISPTTFYPTFQYLFIIITWNYFSDIQFTCKYIARIMNTLSRKTSWLI